MSNENDLNLNNYIENKSFKNTFKHRSNKTEFGHNSKLSPEREIKDTSEMHKKFITNKQSN